MKSGHGSSNQHEAWIAGARAQFEKAKVSDFASSVTACGAPTWLAGRGEKAAPSVLPEVSGYRVVREVRRGGQGVVYEGVQDRTGRTVALKVMRGGQFAAKDDLLRFDREVHILAQLNHRNIVGILDRGDIGGSQFLVMDYIDGLPLDRYARDECDSLEARLWLFAEVCDAVTAAHQRGVIHRDLKPGNILVDESGEPHILDFGLATMSDGPEEGMTRTGQFVGSLPWASPEQALARHAEIDVRSDVYSLGVILYQIITQSLPYSTVGDLDTILSNIRNAEPVRPRLLASGISDDLETIALKSLNKDPARRYQSVGELARDIRHYLANEPIDAKRDSTWYIIARTLSRHKLAVAISLSFILLTTASSLSLLFMYRAKAEEETRAEAETRQAVLAREQAEKSAKKADAVTEFLRTMLGAADPGKDGVLVKVVDVMKKASIEVPKKLAGQPEVQVAVRSALGEAYYGLGLYADAEAEFSTALKTAQQSLGGESGDSLVAMGNLGMVLWVQGKLDKAEEITRKALEIRLRLHLDADPDTLTAMSTLAAILNARGRANEGISWNRRALAVAERVLGPDDPQTRDIRNNLAFSLDKAGQSAEAESLYRSLLESKHREGLDEQPGTLVTAQSLANLLRGTGKLDEAESLARHVLEVRRRIFPPEHPALGDAAQLLGRVLLTRNDAQDAEIQFREALAIHQRSLPADSWRTAVTRCDLGFALTKLHRFEEAEKYLLEANATLAKTPSDHLKQIQDTIRGLSEVYASWEAAEPGTGKADKAAQWRAKLQPTSAPTT